MVLVVGVRTHGQGIQLSRPFDLKRPDPGPFDVAKLMPVAYVVAGVFVCFTILVFIADVVNPVKIS